MGTNVWQLDLERQPPGGGQLYLEEFGRVLPIVHGERKSRAGGTSPPVSLCSPMGCDNGAQGGSGGDLRGPMASDADWRRPGRRWSSRFRVLTLRLIALRRAHSCRPVPCLLVFRKISAIEPSSNLPMPAKYRMPLGSKPPPRGRNDSGTAHGPLWRSHSTKWIGI
jgi:hypothetical protein